MPIVQALSRINHYGHNRSISNNQVITTTEPQQHWVWPVLLLAHTTATFSIRVTPVASLPNSITIAQDRALGLLVAKYMGRQG